MIRIGLPAALLRIAIFLAAPDSPRVIVELEMPPLAVAAPQQAGGLDARSTFAQDYVAALQAEQAAFASTLQAALPTARVGTFTNELGVAEPHQYQIVFNGMAIQHGLASQEAALSAIARLPGVKAVYPDQVYTPLLYTSTALINAPAVWNALGGQANGGAGIKVASMDGGIHHLAPMFAGTGYTYPPGYGPNGLGLTSNNNGKIIVSRAYFRDFDPPAPGDANPWPGEKSTSHGVHTASTAAGGMVEQAAVDGFDLGRISGVAPRAYVMSYRVFYESASGRSSLYTAEALAALEDIVRDGADVVNNSWGGGPGNEGGVFNPIDQALLNAWHAGVFVVMSAGNSGPSLGTTDHPSPAYINVASSSTGGNIVPDYRIRVAGDFFPPSPVSLAEFGPLQPLGAELEFAYLPAAVANPNNSDGCQPWPAGTFTGKAAVVVRGACQYDVQVLNAQQAGALFVIVHNNAAGGDQIRYMFPDLVGDQVMIGSIFAGYSAGTGLLAYFQATPDARVTVSLKSIQAGNVPDRIDATSSRGPGVGNVLKPDIAAPGVNIVAQGYDRGATGEARHLGYGQVSGTSMAAPHVAGAAALLRQAHPAWPTWAIKSALMTTARYMDIYNHDDKPAQPLDMGAGRLDLTRAYDPGVVLNPASLSFGLVTTGTQQSIVVTALSVAGQSETYQFGTLWTGAGFLPTQTTAMPGLTIEPASLTLAPGATAQFTVTFTPAQGRGYDHNQGYLTLDGAQYAAHMPAWARVTYAAPLADILLIDNDGSRSGAFYDYAWYYTSTLQTLGYTYNVLAFDPDEGLPSVAELLAYKAILWFTGENNRDDLGTTSSQSNQMVEYMNSGGRLLVMGPDFADVVGQAIPDFCIDFFFCSRLGAEFIQTSVSGETVPALPVRAAQSAPAWLQDLTVDLSAPRRFIADGWLAGAQVAPPVTSGAGGNFHMDYNVDRADLTYRVTVTATTAVTVTQATIQRGAAGVNGPVEWSLTPPGFTATRVDAATPLALAGVIPGVTPEQVETLLAAGLYVNIVTEQHADGAARGQLEPAPYYGPVTSIDEINSNLANAVAGARSAAIFAYPGVGAQQAGIVGVIARDWPALERPGISYRGRSAYLSFGLEGVNPPAAEQRSATATSVSRTDLLGALMTWLQAEPNTVTIAQTAAMTTTGMALFEAHYAGDVVATRYRWDFGDSSPYITSDRPAAGHGYRCADDNYYLVRVEVTDTLGQVAIGQVVLDASSFCITEPAQAWSLYLPLVSTDPASSGGGFNPAEEVLIPAGSFQMGCDVYNPREECRFNERPLHTVRLSAYYIDKYEVTNARYQACVEAGGCTMPADVSSYTRNPYYGTSTYADYPVLDVTWQQASTFCAWEGKRLPTEAEWEKAARGSSDTRKYPWGSSAPDCTKLNYGGSATDPSWCVGDTTRVGAYPGGASPYGVMDMAGNVWEWVNDWYDDNYYFVSPLGNPQGPTTGDERVARGGSWYYGGDYLPRAASRSAIDPTTSYGSGGLRCVRAP